MDVAEHLVFKGGTSLSKAWNLIQRFSEDVDLAIDREFFGFKGVLSKNQRTNLRRTASTYVTEKFFDELKNRFAEKEVSGLNFDLIPPKSKDQDPRIIDIYYPHVIEATAYQQPKVQIEIGSRSLREPFTVRTFTSLVDEEYADRNFVQHPIMIPSVNPERTFLEKLFLLHEEFHKTQENIRIDRLSRHLYDIYHLAKSEYADKALNDKSLYESIVEHRFQFTKVGEVDYNTHNPKTIDFIPIPEVFEAWKADYKKMLDLMIYETKPPSFDDLITELKILRDKIHSLPWAFEKSFPQPTINQ
jgi:predicted nucleotidyltransferase component of viral defense system